MATETGAKSNEVERSGTRTIIAANTNYDPGKYRAIIYFTGRFDPPQIQLPLTIDIKQNFSNSIAAGLNLVFPTTDSNRGSWYSTDGSLTITELGSQRAKGCFTTILIKDSLAGKTIELTKSTFNFEC